MKKLTQYINENIEGQSISIETIAENLAEFMKLYKKDFITHDELKGARFAVECIFGRETYNKALDIAKEIINK